MSLALLDASSLIYRAVYAPARMSSDDDEPTHGTYIFLRTLYAVLEELKPTHLAFALDGKRELNFRRTLFPEYKAKRPKLSDAEFNAARVQYRRCLELVDLFGCWSFEAPAYEADDVLASLTRRFKSETDVVIVTGDKDMGQLVEPRVSIYDPFKKCLLTERQVEEKWGVPPRFVPCVQALAGDASDNVPGVAGIGPKKAAELVNAALLSLAFSPPPGDPVEALMEEVRLGAGLPEPTTPAAIARSKRLDEADLNCLLQLVRLFDRLDFPVELAQLRFNGLDVRAAAPVLRALGFRSMFDHSPSLV